MPQPLLPVGFSVGFLIKCCGGLKSGSSSDLIVVYSLQCFFNGVIVGFGSFCMDCIGSKGLLQGVYCLFPCFSRCFD